MKSLPAYSPLRRIGFISLAMLLMTAALGLLAQSPLQNVRAQSVDQLGGPLPNLTPLETTLFDTGLQVFTLLWDKKGGLGPVYNERNCSGCHASPVAGGGSPGSTKKDTLFLTPNYDEGAPLLQIHGIGGTPPCDFKREVIPPDATLIAKRLTPQAFGMGLINSIPDSDILAQEAAEAGTGTPGQINWVEDENLKLRPGRFGYKAEAATLVQDIAGSMQQEIGITNPINPDEDPPQGIPIPPNCKVGRKPNDDGRAMISILHFLLYLAPAPPGDPNPNGQALFNSIGCALCHLPSYTTGDKVVVPVDWQGRTILSKALSNQPVPLYSDLLLHDMGGGLQDGFAFGQATGSQFRTTPLWGISTRTAYLNNGIVNTIDEAIREHSSSGSEANQVISNYRALSPADQADLVAFVSSL